MRKLINYFIKFGVAVNVVIIAFVIFGVIGVMNMKSSFFPLQDSRIINISIAYPGSAPEEIEEGIILKIEDNLKGLEGIDRVTSVARESGGSITVEIERGENIDAMLTEVKNAVDRVPTFPGGMEPLVVSKQEFIRETINFAVSGEGVPLATLKQISQQIENDLRLLDGVSQISISGFPQEEIEIAVSENDLLAYDLTFEQVAQAVRNSNILSTGGTIKTDAEDYLIRANNRAYYADALNEIVLKSNATGEIVRLGEIATVKDQFSETPNALYFNGNVAVNISVSNTSSEDLLATAEKINEYVDEFNQKSSNVQLNVVNDQSITLNQRTQLLVENGLMGMILVLFFLSLFLNIRLAFWVAFGLPIAFLGMFIFAGSFGVTINVLSLFGMIIVIGILVDDGIVISENIFQHSEMGKSPIKAALDGTMEVVPPILSAIITTVLAFSTFLFLDSRIGEFFGEVSTVVILTLVVSLVEALIILPAHIAHSKALRRDTGNGSPKKGIGKFFQKMKVANKIGDRMMSYMRDKIYSPVLRFVITQQVLALAILVTVLILTIGAIGGN
ncbi:MAG: efflux RND transporter permease subunit, partial [Gramella sp.]|nr:efflux RND transporter permease subunit [Christiangramia sp.]